MSNTERSRQSQGYLAVPGDIVAASSGIQCRITDVSTARPSFVALSAPDAGVKVVTAGMMALQLGQA